MRENVSRFSRLNEETLVHCSVLIEDFNAAESNADLKCYLRYDCFCSHKFDTYETGMHIILMMNSKYY